MCMYTCHKKLYSTGLYRRTKINYQRCLRNSRYISLAECNDRGEMLVLVQYKTYNRTILQSYIVALPLRLPITSYCLSRVWSCLPCCYTSLQILCCYTSLQILCCYTSLQILCCYTSLQILCCYTSLQILCCYTSLQILCCYTSLQILCCYTSLQILCCLFWNVYVSMEREKLFMSAIHHPSRKRYYHCLSLKVYHKISNFQKEHNKHKNACGELNLDANNYEWSENLINYVAHQLCTSASKPGTKRTWTAHVCIEKISWYSASTADTHDAHPVKWSVIQASDHSYCDRSNT